MLYTLGDSIGAAELVLPALDVLDGEALAQAHLVVATGALLTGELGLAMSSINRGEEVCRSMSSDSSRFLLLRAYVLSFLGRISEAIVLATRFRDSVEAFGLTAPQAFCEWARGGLLLTSGRAREAVGALEIGIDLLERAGIERAPLSARTDLATALAMIGEHTGAETVLVPALERMGTVSDIDGKVHQALGWVRACTGDLDEAAQAFMRAADAYEAAGDDLPSLIALVEAARAGRAVEVLPRIEALAVGVEGVLAEISVRLARALAAAESAVDPISGAKPLLASEFDAIGAAASTIELHVLAAEAYSHAAVLHRAAGDPRRTAASTRMLDEQLSICGVPTVPFVVQQETNPLSDRESQIARLAAEGLSNRQISEQLVLSVRTVETHLQRVYQKLGVRGRFELRDAL
jgi:ATP/maltotriose-dependent transcriptional regulator MalT